MTLPSVYANSAPGAALSGELSLRLATTEGPASLTAADAILYSPVRREGAVELQLSIEAGSVLVNWSRRDSAAIGSSPGNPDDALVSREVSRDGGETRFAGATISGASRPPEANWLLVPEPSGHATQMEIRTHHLSARAATQQTWNAGYPGGVEIGPESSQELSPSLAVPSGQPLASTADAAEIDYHGDARLYLWGINATVKGQDGREEAFASGAWSDQNAGPSRQEHFQLLTLRLSDAAIQIRQASGPVFASSKVLALSGPLAADLEGASGEVRAGGSQNSLDGQHLRLEGELQMEFAARDESRLGARAGGSLSAASVDGVTWPVAAGAVTRRHNPPAATLPFLFGAAAVVLIALAGLAWRRRRSANALDHAEEAILERKPIRARRRLKRILLERPRDANAWFLYGATWLQAGSPERVIEELEPVARSMVGADRWSLAFLLALAHARLNRADDALEWLASAVGEPVFRERAGHEPDFRFLEADPRFRRLIGADPPIYG